jgi:hypothetical protein
LKLATEITEGTEEEEEFGAPLHLPSLFPSFISFSVPSEPSVAKQKNKERPFNLSFRRLALLG